MINLRLSPKTHEALRRVAREQERSMSGQARWVVERWLAEQAKDGNHGD